MAELGRSDTVTKTIAAVQEEQVTLLMREDDNDDETVHGLEMVTPTIDTSMFDVFTDFNLDLTCLSRPGSPVASTSEMPPSTPSPPASPPSSPMLSRSISFISQPTLVTMTKKSSKKSSSQQLSSTVPANSRGSWPLIKYAGRGTPIDRNRRLEWGGFSSDDVVAEDGILFSAVRSTSLDSAIRPSMRSISPEWTYTSPLSSSLSHSTHSEHHSSLSSRNESSVDSEPPPEIAPIQGLGTDKSDEWDSIMKTVLSSSTDLLSSDAAGDAAKNKDQEHDVNTNAEGSTSASNPNKPGEEIVQLSPEQLEQLNNGLEIDLGLDAALDLGLGQRGGMNWFDLGLLPKSARAAAHPSGRDSPSVYSSQAATPRASMYRSEHASEHRSTTSTKTGGVNAESAGGLKSAAPNWWQKMLLRIRRVQTIITIHKHRF